MATLSKACAPDNFELHKSLKLTFTNIWDLCSSFVDRQSVLESKSPDILALCETNLDDSIDCGNFSVRGYLPLIGKDSSTNMHGLAVYIKEGLPLAQDVSLENSADSYLCFQLALLHSVSYFFFLYRSPSSALCTVFDSVSSNIDEVLSINPSANVFIFGDSNVHHKDWTLIIFLSQMTLFRWLTFLLASLTVVLTVLLFWIYLFLLMQVFVLQWLFLCLEIQIMLLSLFSLIFLHIHNGMPCFIALLMTILVLTNMVLMIIWEMFKLSASAASKIFHYVQVVIDV